MLSSGNDDRGTVASVASENTEDGEALFYFLSMSLIT